MSKNSYLNRKFSIFKRTASSHLKTLLNLKPNTSLWPNDRLGIMNKLSLVGMQLPENI